MAWIFGTLVLSTCATTTCEPGYYPSGTECLVCPAGSSCSGTAAPLACSSQGGTFYSGEGQSSCSTISANLKTGWRVTSSSSIPGALSGCPVGTNPSTNSVSGSATCTQCSSSTTYNSNPETSCAQCTTGVADISNRDRCMPCTEGSFCSNGVATTCAANGRSLLFANTATSCTSGATQASAGTFAPTTKLSAFTNPTGSYSAAGATAFTTCAAGKSCTNTATSSCTASTQFSGVQTSTCSSPYNGYKTLSTSSGISQTINWGTYGSSSTTCEVNAFCSGSASTVCPTGYYSTSGWDFCRIILPNYQISGTPTTSSTPTICPTTSAFWTPNSCVAITSVIMLAGGAIQMPCQAGTYLDSTTNTCKDCIVGHYCPNGITDNTQGAQTNPTYNVVYKTKQISPTPCPGGYICTSPNAATGTITQLASSSGKYSIVQTSNDVQKDFVTATDLGGGMCPWSANTTNNLATYYTTNRFSCAMNTKDFGASATSGTPAQCSSHTWAWFGEPCQSQDVNTTNTDNWNQEDAFSTYMNVHCPGGMTVNGQNVPTSADNYVCSNLNMTGTPGGGSPYERYAHESIRGVSVKCPATQVNNIGFTGTGGILTTMYTDITSTNLHFECRECIDNAMCIQSSGGGYGGWCWGKNPSLIFYDNNYLTNTPPLTPAQMQIDDRRVATNYRSQCFDCNAKEYKDGICTFASDYFFDHTYSGKPPTSMIVLCPFQSLQRTVTRYLDKIGFQRTDSLSTTYTLGSAYQSSAWFFDKEYNIYGWSYCKIDVALFTSYNISSHQFIADYAEVTKQDCSIYEHLSVNQPDCHPNSPGFISVGDQDTPTETAIQGNYITQLAQYDDYTGIALSQCPYGTSPSMSEGKASVFLGCRTRDLGNCNDAQTADYCNSGFDFQCPSGFYKNTGLGTFSNTINDCTNCPAGSTCNGAVGTTTTCPNGYICQSGTVDLSSYPTQPGDYVAVGSQTIQTCIGGYCPGAGTQPTNCLTGYSLPSGVSATGHHSQAGCTPNQAGNYISSGTTQSSCPSSGYCPEGTSTSIIQSPPGYFASSTGITSQDSLSVCSAGSWCAGNGATTTSCTSGFYCEHGTQFQYEYPCQAGTFSAAGAASQTGCSSCSSGSYCREGGFSNSDNSLCAASGYLCDSGANKRTTCTAGQTPTVGNTCVACPANQFCLAGAPATQCAAGWTSTGSLGQCVDSTAGTVTATAGATPTNAGAGTWTLQGQVTPFPCPAGYSCTGGVKTLCPAGKVCTEGLSTPITASTTQGSATYQDVTGLMYQKKCKPGKQCGSSTTDTPIGQYTNNGDNGATAKYCSSGYQCAAGSIGPFASPCPAGEYYTTGTAGGACVTCAAGSYCNQAAQTICEAGFFCDVTTATSASFHQSCPKGTFAAGTGTVDQAACTKCTGGKACTQPSAIAATYSCAPGYFCYSGSTSTQPQRMTSSEDSVNTYQCDPTLQANAAITCNQGICPFGYYCAGGTTSPVACPSGYYAGGFGARAASDCIKCQQGFYCPDSKTSTLCVAGTYCPLQSSAASLTPLAGQFSLSGYPAAVPCQPGTFQIASGQGSCVTCTAGSQCPNYGMTSVQTCNQGSDCSQTGVIFPLLCPYGKYLDPSNTVNPTCITCPLNKFCYNDGVILDQINGNPSAVTYAGTCPNGYNCVSGAPIDYVNIIFTGTQTYYLCTLGNYCNPSDSSGVTLNPCPAGTYMPRYGAQVSSDCVPCKPGYQCATAGLSAPQTCTTGYQCAQGTSSASVICNVGKYCPTNAEVQYPCPYGMYQDAIQQTSCKSADAGSYVDNQGQSATTTCTVGYYCPIGSTSGTVTPIACPQGLLTTAAGKSLQTDCTNSNKNLWIKSPTVQGTIADGYNSIATGEVDAIPTLAGSVCSIGYFCAGGVSTICVAGTYCDQYQMSTNTLQCTAGYYCQAGTTCAQPLSLSVQNGALCTAGNYCTVGSSVPIGCLAGTYSDAIGLQAATECHVCSDGKVCATVAGLYSTMTQCPVGYWCGPGTASDAAATLCQPGYQCPVGSTQQVPCTPGYYNPSVGTTQSTCTICPLGSFCQFYYTLPSGQASQQATCPIGQYCANTGLDAGAPCLPGYFQAATGQQSCTICTAGFYCPLGGMSAPIACPEQFICKSGSVIPTLCADGYLCTSATPTSQTTPTLCPTGKFCIQGLAATCFQGYICVLGASTPTPNDGAKGYVCPAGFYCAAGATTPTACAIGTYNSYQGAGDISFCIVCPSGTTCPNTGTAYPTPVDCPAGYICQGGVQIPCSLGMYCPSGTLVMIPCAEGTYQDTQAQTSCKACTAGNHCLRQSSTLGCAAPVTCPIGYFCQEGTGQLTGSQCPLGTYGAAAGLSTQLQCTNCDATYYCPQVAMTSSSNYHDYVCPPGYICNSGSSSSTGTSQCPIDNFCTAGLPTLCPDGKYAKVTGSLTNSECVMCSPGKYCPSHSLGIQNCPAGFYCVGGDFQSSTFVTCPQGSFCPSGSFINQLCLPGTYQDQTQQTACKICPAGSYCPTSGMTAPTSCATAFSNYYCPTGSIYPTKCPTGTYVQNQQTCTSCPAGKYCWPDSANANDGTQGDCAYSEGYLCRSGSFTPRPLVQGIQFIQSGSMQSQTYNGPALQGQYAGPLGVSSPCAIGTFATGFYNTQCVSCYKGSYCPSTGMQSIVGYRCSAGYYCLIGNTQSTPVAVSSGGSIIGDICPVGKYCGYNLIQQMVCPDGFYSDITGLQMCKSCPVGSYCDTIKSVSPIKCIPGSTCQGGSLRQSLCPSGTYYNSTYLNCTVCNATNYCRAGVMADKCAAGYLCDTADYVTQPNPAGKECQPGYYCPLGNMWAYQCPYQTQSVVIAAKQLADCTGCQPGYLCPIGTNTAIPCPMGFYCPPQGAGLLYPKKQYPCELGTWNPQTLQLYQSDCYDCLPGYYCNQTALTNITLYQCPMGHYCPGRTVKPIPCAAGTFVDFLGALEEDQCETCPLGFYCPMGSQKPIRCDDGFYCPIASAAPLTCQGGHYCNNGSNHQMVICPINTYCPRGSKYPKNCDLKHTCDVGTEIQVFCPNGYYVQNMAQYGGKNLCLACEAGTYSTTPIIGCDPCPAGYLCYGGTNSDVPRSVELNNGEICPKGNYCPSGSSYPIMCPPGSFNPKFGGKSLADCLLCPVGTSNSQYGAAGCQPCGEFASSSEGSQLCTCIGKNRAYSPKDSSCRCITGFDFKNPDGVSQGQSSSSLDCIPIVYDNCGSNFVRAPNGVCAAKNDCKTDCQGGNGTRDGVSGVCKCEKIVGTDQICNQACRNSAPKSSISPTGGQLTLQTANGKIESIDLSQYGDVYGRPAINSTGVVNTVQMRSSGFSGSYDPKDALKLPQTSLKLAITSPQGQNSTKSSTNKTSQNNTSQTNKNQTADSQNKTSSQNQTNITSKAPQNSKTTQSSQQNNSKTNNALNSTNSIQQAGGSQATQKTQNNTAVNQKNSSAQSTNTSKTIKSQNQTGKPVRRQLEHQLDELLDDSRNLQTSPQPVSTSVTVSNTGFSNPVYCISVGDSFLFTITDPMHYPVYMKDSVMNTNPRFDYGSFLDLAQNMNTKQANGELTPSLFSFTFENAGNYVFNDASTTSALMIVSVKALGQTCSDPDRYLQVISGESLASFGISQNRDLITKPHYDLYGALITITFLFTAFIMGMIRYCMIKGWFIREPSRQNYRSQQAIVNFSHKNQTVFDDNNEFVYLKSDLISYEEDDLDNLNLDVQQDLVESGTRYIQIFEKQKQKHKSAKAMKKQQVFHIKGNDSSSRKQQIDQSITEIEELVNIMISDSAAGNMHWVDISSLHDESSIDDEKAKKQIEKKLSHLHKTEEKQNEAYQKMRQEMLRDASELERLQYERSKATLSQNNYLLKDEFEITQLENLQVTAEYAIYDNGNLKSENNKLIVKIASDKTLTEHQKEMLLKAHESGLHNIQEVLESEKKRQEQELDRALQERLARRHRIKESQHSNDIKQEIKNEERKIMENFEEKKQTRIEKLFIDHEIQLKNLLQTSDVTQHRTQIQQLENLTGQKRKQVVTDIDNERDQEIEKVRQAIEKKYKRGATSEQEIQDQILQLFGESNHQQAKVLREAEIQRAKQEEKLREQLATKRQKFQQKIQSDFEKQQYTLSQEDVLLEHEREVVSMEAQIRLKLQQVFQDKFIKVTSQQGALGIDKQGLPILDVLVVKAADIARKEELDRKNQIKESKFKLLQEIDITIEKNSLLAELESQDATLAIALKQQTNAQNAKLAARKAHLKSRRLARHKSETDELIVKQKLEVYEEEQVAKKEISEAYIRALFRETPKNESTQQRNKRLELLNEYLSDQFMDQLAILLNKQFVEKDGLLKLCLHKYMEILVTEITAVKEQFKIDHQSLQHLLKNMNETSYNEFVKQIRLNEENILKETELRITRARAEEEASIRKELDKKHCQEQIEFRNYSTLNQAQLRTQLIGDSNFAKQEYGLENQALEKYQSIKNTEQERRLRNTELHKKTLTNQIDSEIKNRYDDYDDMIRRKKQQQRELEDQTSSITKRIQDRKDKLKKALAVQGMSKQDQETMLKNYQEQLDQLDSAYATEQRRQQLIMRTKQENRKKRLVKLQQLKQAIEKQPVNHIAAQNRLAGGLKSIFKRSLAVQSRHNNENDQLVKRMNAWRQQKKVYETQQLLAKIANSIVEEKTPMVQGLTESSPDFKF